MQSPAMLTATLPLTGNVDAAAVSAAQQMLMHLKIALKAQLHADGWRDVPLTDFRATTYWATGAAHHVVSHTPRNIPGVLIGGAEDGAVFEITGHAPSLTIGMLSGSHIEDSLDCESGFCVGDECESSLEPEEWTHWKLAGLARSDDQWCWAYVTAKSYGVTRMEQRLHDEGSAHKACVLCRLERYLRRTLTYAGGQRAIAPRDARQHAEIAPHSDFGCTACHVALPMGKEFLAC